MITAAALGLVVVCERWQQGRRDIATEDPREQSAPEIRAEHRHRQAGQILRAAKFDAGLEHRSAIPSSCRGFVGQELSPLVTTLGSLDAKVTAASPRWAAALTRQLASHGIAKGDLVVASFSGSFPGLNVALIAACQALEVDVVGVSSVTASTWGATEPGFTWPEMEVRLVSEGVILPVSRGISIGGSGDCGADLSPAGKEMAQRIQRNTALALGATRLESRSLSEAIASRMKVLDIAAGGRQPALYASVGGNHASLGGTPAILRVRSGFVPARPFDRSQERGMVARFAERGVPTLLLLNVRELELQWAVATGSD